MPGLHGETSRKLGFLASRFVFSDTRFYHLPNQRHRQRLVESKLHGSFGRSEALQLIGELLDHGVGRKQAAVVGKSGEPYQHASLFERRNPVADYFRCRGWHGGANGRAKLRERRTCLLWNPRHVLRDRFCSWRFLARHNRAFPRGATAGRLRLFHKPDATGTDRGSLFRGFAE